MTSVETASHLATLMTIDAYLDDIGVTHTWLNDEMAFHLAQLQKGIEEDVKARNRNDSDQHEDGTSLPSSEPRRRLTDREHGNQQP